jgi:hypothetical protein
MRYALACLLLSLLPSGAALADPSPRPLYQLNTLAQTLSGDQVVAAAEVERLFEQAEVVAFRDSTRGVTPQAVNYAANCERSYQVYTLKGAGPARVLTELALALAPFSVEKSSWQVERFRALVMASLGIKAADAKPMPEFPAQLVEIGEWAARTVEKMAPHLPTEEAVLARVRLRVLRHEFAEAAALAQGQGPRAQVWRNAALVLDGKKPDGPLESGSIAIVRRARLAQTRTKAAEIVGGDALARCHRLFRGPSGGASTAIVLACTQLLWEEADRSWLERAVRLVPAGPAGAPIRAAEHLRVLFSPGRPGFNGRADILDRYRAELKLLEASPEEKRALWLLGNVAAADEPLKWVPTSPDEQREMLALDKNAPCDAATFALRALAVRGNSGVLAAFATSVAERCVKAPGGTAVVADALGLLLTFAHDGSGLVKPDTVEKLALTLAEAHPTDPEAIGAHADIVAARALVLGEKAPVFALEAALGRYEEAIKRTTPSSGALLRARLQQNAGFLSMLLALRVVPAKSAMFLQRAQRHLRFAVALDENPAIIATRAQFDMTTNVKPGVPPVFERIPPSAAKTRAACWLAAQHGSSPSGKRYLELAKKGDKSKLDAPELLLAPQAAFNVMYDDRGLHPAAEMRAPLWLAPACDPNNLPKPASSHLRP